MSESCCGKSCDFCTMGMETGCPGCDAVKAECDLARCCQEKGHETCASCTHNPQCERYQSRDREPQARIARRKEMVERQENLKQRGTFLSRQMLTLFWAMICANVVSLAVEWIFQSAMAGKIVEILCLATYALTLVQMAPQCPTYRKAGMLQLMGTFMDIPLMFQQNELSILLSSLVATALCIVGGYFEYRSHSNVLEDVDPVQSLRWRKLWKWLIGVQCVTILGIFLSVLAVGMLMIMVGAIGVLVVSVFQLVYLYRSARLFRNLGAE